MNIKISQLQAKRLISEAYITDHSEERVNQRILQLPEEYQQEIFKKIEKLKDRAYPKNRSVGVLLYQFNEIVRIKQHDGFQTGDQLWVIVRENVIATIILEKSYKLSTEREARKKLRVNFIDNTI